MIDIGINLTNKAFRSDRDSVIARAENAGVTGMVVTGTTIDGSREAAELARTRPGFLFATAGIHPHNASTFDEESLAVLRDLAADDEVVALGECGLDYNRDFSPRPAQDACFAAQIELAAELGMPLFMHERDAHSRLVEILHPLRDGISRGVVHCFTGTEEELRAYLDLDLHIGMTGWICDERRGRHLRDIVSLIPIDRLMIETDAPYLIPRDIVPRPKTRRNEPCHLPHIASAVAVCRGVDFAVIRESTAAVSRAFFGWAT